ncbi:LPXTG cell wall anchor domain-containing protein [Limosilactobacillus vaginalis]|uniref:LPXTG cell wall anchor domain-containing protein n=1 Tax=Limosilactobacillus vaginalis TaxID=1633 RepID=UPI00174DCB3F|nr:KxYKxGKxW signal peptide domain-containing protein [Limosilactobacillus vaginalis]
MENRNNALHYKMYKSGKSIVFAGLATTAALAGLTLANANATTVHADTATPASEAVTTNTNSAAATSAEIASQEAVVNSASAALNSAQQLNKGVAAVSDAQEAFNSAHNAYSDAQVARWNAHDKASKLNSQVKRDQEWVNFWNNGGEAKYNEINNMISDNQKIVDALPDAQSAYDDAHAALHAANNDPKTDKKSVEYQALQSNYDLANSNWKQYNKAKNAITDLNNKLNGKEKVTIASGQYAGTQSINFVVGKKAVDGFDALKAKADQLNKDYQKALDSVDAAAKISTSKKQELQNIRDQYLIYTNEQLGELSQKVYNAKGQIKLNNAKLAQLKTKNGNTLKEAQEHLKNANTKLDQAKKAMDLAQKQLDKLQAVVDNAKTDIERHNAQRVLNNWKNGAYKIASDSVAANQKNVDAWNAQVNEIKDMPEYIALTNSNAAMQQVIDNYDQAKINSANAEKVAAEIAPLQDAYDKAVSLLKAYQTSLADAQAKLAAMKGETTPSEKPGDNEGNKPGNDDQQQPGDNQGNDSSVNGGSASTNNGAASTTVNGNHAATNKVVAASTTVNGNHAATNKVVAASLASVKASTKGASAAATAKDSNVLPQTGNENSAAVVALGAVSAMFGLGLAAKKREF